MLQIVLIAARPLILAELDIALHVNKQTSSYADLELEGSSRLQEILPSRYGLMVSIVQSKVYFIHQTVKELLLGKASTEHPAGRVWQQSLGLEESYGLMTTICLRSISVSETNLYWANLYNALLSEDYREITANVYCQNYIFLSYSAVHWTNHFPDQGRTDRIQTIKHFLNNSNCSLVSS